MSPIYEQNSGLNVLRIQDYTEPEIGNEKFARRVVDLWLGPPLPLTDFRHPSWWEQVVVWGSG